MDTLRLFRSWPSIRYHYGTMEAGKSLQLLVTAHQLKQKDVEYCVLYACPSHDHRMMVLKNCSVSSRSGLPPHAAIPVEPCDDIRMTINTFGKNRVKLTHILIEEAQFLTRDHIVALREWVESDPSHRVDCYGLKTDFKGEFFPGSLTLMQCADELIEVPSLCSRCMRPATHNMRLDEKGNAIGSGDQVALKETTTYVAVCYCCWNTALSKLENGNNKTGHDNEDGSNEERSNEEHGKEEDSKQQGKEGTSNQNHAFSGNSSDEDKQQTWIKFMGKEMENLGRSARRNRRSRALKDKQNLYETVLNAVMPSLTLPLTEPIDSAQIKLREAAIKDIGFLTPPLQKHNNEDSQLAELQETVSMLSTRTDHLQRERDFLYAKYNALLNAYKQAMRNYVKDGGSQLSKPHHVQKRTMMDMDAETWSAVEIEKQFAAKHARQLSESIRRK